MPDMTNRTLRNVALFKGLGDEALARWEAQCKWQTFDEGEFIVQAEDDTCDVFFLTEGRAHVIIYAPDGETVPFRHVMPGGMFGEFAAVDNQRRSATVEAAEPCLVACITANNFRKLLKGDNATTMALLKYAIGQIRALTDRVFAYSTLDVPKRILAHLVSLAQDGVVKGKEVHICPFPLQQEIADLLSTHREAVPREIAALRKEKIVERRGKVFVILDLDRLVAKMRSPRRRRRR
jgi:CRP-like cAMP-binding protein